jgi:hypothetical protein
MRRIKLYIETGFVGCRIETTIEVDDDTSDKCIDELAQDFLFEKIEYGWKELPKQEENEE